MRTQLPNLSPTAWIVIALPVLVAARCAATIVVPQVVRAVVPEVVRSVLRTSSEELLSISRLEFQLLSRPG
jgi:hypothetical protein